MVSQPGHRVLPTLLRSDGHGKVGFSRTLRTADWANTTIAAHDNVHRSPLGRYPEGLAGSGESRVAPSRRATAAQAEAATATVRGEPQACLWRRTSWARSGSSSHRAVRERGSETRPIDGWMSATPRA